MNVPHNTVTAETKAAVLAEVLPYIRRFAGSVFVVKYGGNAMTEQHLKEGFAKDITLLKLVGIHPVIVHGGGPQINEMLEKIGKKGEFVQGMRVTDDETMSIVEMVLGGLVNKEIVSLLNQSGAKAVGITGRDNHFIKAEKLLIDTPEQTQADIGRVGTVESIDTALITGIIERGCIPVVAPIGVGKDGGAFNINADLVAGMRHNVIENLASRYIDDDQVRQNWDLDGLEAALRNEFGMAVDIQSHWLQANPNMSAKQIKEGLVELLEHIQQEKENQVGGDIMRRVEKYIALQTIDTQWKQHLATMDMLRQAIWLRSRAQKDPKREYQRESFELFKDLLDHIQFEIVRVLAHIQFQAQSAADEAEAMQQQAQRQHDAELARAQYHGSSDSSEALREPTPEEIARTGRNDPCPCGSGKRLKDCHGKLA